MPLTLAEKLNGRFQQISGNVARYRRDLDEISGVPETELDVSYLGRELGSTWNGTGEDGGKCLSNIDEAASLVAGAGHDMLLVLPTAPAGSKGHIAAATMPTAADSSRHDRSYSRSEWPPRHKSSVGDLHAECRQEHHARSNAAAELEVLHMEIMELRQGHSGSLQSRRLRQEVDMAHKELAAVRFRRDSPTVPNSMKLRTELLDAEKQTELIVDECSETRKVHALSEARLHRVERELEDAQPAHRPVENKLEDTADDGQRAELQRLELELQHSQEELKQSYEVAHECQFELRAARRSLDLSEDQAQQHRQAITAVENVCEQAKSHFKEQMEVFEEIHAFSLNDHPDFEKLDYLHLKPTKKFPQRHASVPYEFCDWQAVAHKVQDKLMQAKDKCKATQRECVQLQTQIAATTAECKKVERPLKDESNCARRLSSRVGSNVSQMSHLEQMEEWRRKDLSRRLDSEADVVRQLEEEFKALEEQRSEADAEGKNQRLAISADLSDAIRRTKLAERSAFDSQTQLQKLKDAEYNFQKDKARAQLKNRDVQIREVNICLAGAWKLENAAQGRCESAFEAVQERRQKIKQGREQMESMKVLYEELMSEANAAQVRADAVEEEYVTSQATVKGTLELDQAALEMQLKHPPMPAAAVQLDHILEVRKAIRSEVAEWKEALYNAREEALSRAANAGLIETGTPPQSSHKVSPKEPTQHTTQRRRSSLKDGDSISIGGPKGLLAKRHSADNDAAAQEPLKGLDLDAVLTLIKDEPSSASTGRDDHRDSALDALDGLMSGKTSQAQACAQWAALNAGAVAQGQRMAALRTAMLLEAQGTAAINKAQSDRAHADNIVLGAKKQACAASERH